MTIAARRTSSGSIVEAKPVVRPAEVGTTRREQSADRGACLGEYRDPVRIRQERHPKCCVLLGVATRSDRLPTVMRGICAAMAAMLTQHSRK
jgi:hypothetical protein